VLGRSREFLLQPEIDERFRGDSLLAGDPSNFAQQLIRHPHFMGSPLQLNLKRLATFASASDDPSRAQRGPKSIARHSENTLAQEPAQK
jgi:hypothetical protein